VTLLGATVATPWKPMSLIVDAASAPTVVAAAFIPLPALARKAGIAARTITPDNALEGVTEVVARYLDGDLDAFDAVDVRQPGGPFMQDCWAALRTVRAGTVVSYAELAALAGRPKAVRAAGTACATNLIAPVIPCHRVVRTGGDVGNYGFGVPLKVALLKFEGAHD
jgi:methylated-DNA-[protein]-cysteine S-methyltransferase